MADYSSASYLVRSVIEAKLAARFNTAYAEAAALYSAPPITFDFSASSVNFFKGRLGPDELEKSGTTFKYPLMFLYSRAGVQQNLQKFHRFSGVVRVGLDVHLSYKESQAIQNFEKGLDAVEQAVLNTFNKEDAQSWPDTVVYNGLISFERSSLVVGGLNWLQSLYVQLTLDAVLK